MRGGKSWSGHERNCCFLNLGQRRMADISAVSGLDFADDARAILVGDWDHDGDLDLWVNNRNGPRLRFMRNDCRADAHYVAFQLQGVASNRDGIGARIELQWQEDSTRRQIMTRRAGDGFHAQSSKCVHFGIGEESSVDQVTVRWPNGDRQTFQNVAADHRYLIIQGSAELQRLPTRIVPLTLASASPQVPAATSAGRVVCPSRPPLPQLVFEDFDGQTHALPNLASQRAVLINLWASWCAPCVEEFNGFSRQKDALNKAGINVVALSVDGLDESQSFDQQTVRKWLRDREFPHLAALATPEIIDTLEVVQRALIDLEQPLPLPSSVLVDPKGRVAVIYKGPVAVKQLVKDAAMLDDVDGTLHQAATPFPGRWRGRPKEIAPMAIALKFYEGGYIESVLAYAEQCVRGARENRPGYENVEPADFHYFVGTLYEGRGDLTDAIDAYRQTVRADADYLDAHRNLGRLFLQQQKPELAVSHLREVVRLRDQDTEAIFTLGIARSASGDRQGAADAFSRVLELRPGWPAALNNLAWILATTEPPLGDGAKAVELAQELCQATRFTEPVALNTLAAAYAQAGDFTKAQEYASEAKTRFEQLGNKAAAEEAADRLEQYRREEPYRE